MASPARMRFLYLANVILPGFLGVLHLAAPGRAAALVWGGARPTLAHSMLGAWWAGIAALSVLGLRNPLKYSPIMLLQIFYKVAFLSVTIAPLAAAGRWSSFPAGPTAVYAAYLPLLLYCVPWGYLLGSGETSTSAFVKKTA